ncbi:TIGR03986 family type III CRISPR-associated RAMP protein [Streptomyces sp. NPDC001680]
MTGSAAPRRDGDSVFVNPYTFVPLPDVTDPAAFRRAPAGHDRLATGRLSGRIEVELTARSPLLLRGIRPGEDETFPRRVFPGHPREGDGGPGTAQPSQAEAAASVPFLPGSSLAGTIRSLHEVLAGGCLRIFDADYRPGYRDPVSARGADWSLAVVEDVRDDGRPVRLRLCARYVWVEARRLAAPYVLGSPDRVVTGARVHVSDWEESSLGRLEVTEDRWVRAGDDREDTWVVQVTDSGARKPRKSFWCAVGERTDSPDLLVTEITDRAWEDYRKAVEGANDVRLARAEGTLATAEPRPEPVHYDDELVGHRHQVRPHLHPGQVLWVRTEEQTRVVAGWERQVTVVEQLALSHVWRHAGRHAAGERVPDELHPCDHSERLCPTCRVFGAADPHGSAAGSGNRQTSYRGHIRFGDARPLDTAGVRTESVRLAPLGAPRPGAGQFYLEPKPGVRPVKGRPPLREWGSPADGREAGGPRRLRGRKQYWLTGRHTERPYFRVREGKWEGEMAADAECVPAGTRFAFTVYVEGLDTAELGGLLAALDPSLLFGEGVGYAVGGGKPLGFGSCTARITGVHLADAASRYTGASPAAEWETAAAVEAFRAATDPGVATTWAAARAALTLDRVEPGNVWYPPESPIPQGELRPDDLSPGLGGFWKYSRGEQLAKSTRDLIALPDPTAPDQSLKVIGEDGRPA